MSTTATLSRPAALQYLRTGGFSAEAAPIVLVNAGEDL